MDVRCKGFTLVELIIIILVLGILTAVGMPALTAAYDNYKLEGAVDQVTSDIRYAQSMAIRTRLPYTVQFPGSTNTYMVKEGPGGSVAKHPLIKQKYEIDFNADGPFRGVAITSADFGGFNRVTFDEFGAPLATGSVTLSYAGRTKTIQVDAIGRITVL